MRILYDLDRFYLPKTIHIVPSESEDSDTLHNISSHLMVDNPAIEFINAAKLGLFDQIDDSQYEKMLAVAKRLSLLFYSPDAGKATQSINLFDLTVRLLYEYMLNQHTEASRIL